MAVVMMTGAASAAHAAPALHVVEPLDDTVGRPTVHVAADCDGGGGAPCATVTLLAQTDGGERRDTLGIWQDAAHVELDVPLEDGGFVDLELHATDAAGTGTMVRRRVWGDTSAALHEVVSVDGAIDDADLDRVLYEVDGEVRILHRDGCGEERAGAGHALALTPAGALLTACGAEGCVLTEWRDGARLGRGPVDPGSLRVAGGFATWSEGFVPGPLHRLDLAHGDDVVVSAVATPGSGAVGADGVVTYSTITDGKHVAHRWTPGGDAALGAGDLSATDGTLAIFTDDDAPTCALRLYAGDACEDLSDLCTSPTYLATVRNGWTAFVRPDDTGARQLWTRDPAGVRTQLTTGGCTLAPPIADDGSVLATTTIGADAGRWLFAPGAAPRLVTRSQPHWIDHAGGRWLIAIGRTLFTTDAGDLPCSGGACAACTAAPGGDGSGAGSGRQDAGLDAGALGDTPPTGCSATGGGAAPWLLALAALALISSRRRPWSSTARCDSRS